MDTDVITRTKRSRGAVLAGVVVLLVGGLAVLSNVAQGWTTVTGRFALTLGGADPRMPVVDLPQVLQASVREGRSMLIEDVPAYLRVLSATPALLAALTFLASTILVRRVLLSIAAGDAFGERVRSALTWLSVTLVVGGLLQGLLDTVAVAALWDWSLGFMRLGNPSAPALDGLALDLPQWPVMIIVLGLVTGALTLAFRQGARLQAETEGLV